MKIAKTVLFYTTAATLLCMFVGVMYVAVKIPDGFVPPSSEMYRPARSQ